MIDLINFEFIEKELRRFWIKSLVVVLIINLFIYRYGNYLGNINFVWKIFLEEKKCDVVVVVRNVNLIKDDVLKFVMCCMRKDFIDRYFCKCKI